MTHEQYWDGDNHLPSAYRKAYELERNRVNADQWRQGAYIHNALLSALSGLGNHPHPYLDAPFPLTEAEAEMQDDERARRKYEKARAEFLGR